MFYKRISDLHPLGRKTGSTWNDLTPIGIPDSMYYDVTSSQVTFDYRDVTGTHTESRTASQLPYPELRSEFNRLNVWKDDGLKNHDPIPHVTGEPQSEYNAKLDSEYYSKSLWFEVAVSKNRDNKPASGTGYYGVNKYQSKRVNAYLLFQNIDRLHADRIDAPMISAINLTCSDITSTRITANQISATTITANYGNIASISSTSITTQAISSNIGIVTNISGDKLYYQDAQFTNITVTGVANLTAEAAYWADVAEIYTADKGYLYGTLVKFGGEKEITVADDKANAVVSEKPAITLNSGNRDEHATPIVLTGRSKVRTIHPVKKFDKIYLSENPGVGCISSYKISTATVPVGIALEDKPYDEEGLVECVLQLNFE